MLVLRPEAAILFINADWIRAEVWAHVHRGTPSQVVAIDLEESPDLDVAGVTAIRSLRETARDVGEDLWLTNAHANVDAALRRAGLLVGTEDPWVFTSHLAAVAEFQRRRDIAPG